MNTQSTLQKRDTTEVSYVPLGSEDAVKISLKIVKQLIATPTKTGALPSERDCLRLIALCRAQRLNPFERDVYIVGYDGKNGPEFSIIVSHNVFLKRACADGKYNGMESGIVVSVDGVPNYADGEIVPEGAQLVGGWAKVHVKGREYPSFTTLPLRSFIKDNKFWQDNAGGMIRKCAEKDALAQAFPNVLGLCAAVALGNDSVDLGSLEVARDVAESTVPIEQRTTTGADPVREISSSEPGTKPTLQSTLEAAGVTFDQFHRWATEMGHLSGQHAGWDAVPPAIQARLLRVAGQIIETIRNGGAL